MPKTKTYVAPGEYEKKLARVMERFEVQEYNYNWDRHSCWVEFRYKGELYRFDHSVKNAQERGFNIRYGSDAFAQEDFINLLRASEQAKKYINVKVISK